jgi:hypothetical protein
LEIIETYKVTKDENKLKDLQRTRVQGKGARRTGRCEMGRGVKLKTSKGKWRYLPFERYELLLCQETHQVLTGTSDVDAATANGNNSEGTDSYVTKLHGNDVTIFYEISSDLNATN